LFPVISQKCQTASFWGNLTEHFSFQSNVDYRIDDDSKCDLPVTTMTDNRPVS